MRFDHFLSFSYEQFSVIIQKLKFKALDNYLCPSSNNRYYQQHISVTCRKLVIDFLIVLNDLRVGRVEDLKPSIQVY